MPQSAPSLSSTSTAPRCSLTARNLFTACTHVISTNAKDRNLRFAAPAVAFAVAAALAALPAAAQKKPRAAMVKVDKVIIQPVSQTVPILGRLVARRTGAVAARTRGPVKAMLVEVGDRVKRGQVLARLVSDRQRWSRAQEAAALKQRQAELATRRAEVRMAQQEVKRLERLRDSRSAAFRVALYDDKQLEVIKLKSQVSEAKAAISRARANLALADLDLKYADILAPFPGVVARRHTEVGAYVNIGEPLLTIIDDATLEIEADVPADRLSALHEGTRIDFTLAGRRLQATVRAIIPDENPLTRTRAVRFTAPLNDGGNGNGNGEQLAANQSVSLEIPVGQSREIVTVHKDAVLNRKGRDMVYKVMDGKAVAQAIVIGEGIGGRFEVKKGLTPGDIVVVRGNERLFPGQAVRF